MSSNTGTPHPPPELLVEHRDALIIYAEHSHDDKNKAHELLEAIKDLSFDGGIRGKGVLYDQAVAFGHSLVSGLDEALKCNTLVFVIYSGDLENDEINGHTSNASLWHTIENQAKSDTFIPVIWQDGVSMPAYANERQPLNMRNDNWKDMLKSVIRYHLRKRLRRSSEQKELLRSRYPDVLLPEADGDLTNNNPLRHVITPSENRNGPGNLLHRLSLDNIDIHLNPQNNVADGVENGCRAPRSFWNYVTTVNNRRGFYMAALGFGLISVVVITWRARLMSLTKLVA